MGSITSQVDGPARFWRLWLLTAWPWAWVWLNPMVGGYAALASLLPAGWIIGRRLKVVGLTPWLLLPAGLAIAFGLVYGMARQSFAMGLAAVTGWPGGRGLLDLGDVGGLFPILGATIGFAAFSLTAGLKPTRPS